MTRWGCLVTRHPYAVLQAKLRIHSRGSKPAGDAPIPAGYRSIPFLLPAVPPPADPFLKEIHTIREKLAKEMGYHIEKIAEAARKRQAESGRKAVTQPPRPVGQASRNDSD